MPVESVVDAILGEYLRDATVKTIEIDKASLKSLLVLASVIEARDPFTAGHIWRTSRYAALLAEKAGLSRGDVFLAQLGGLVHDLGKIGIPDALLHKRGRLTPEEYEQIKEHPHIGHSIIANHPLAPLVKEPITLHHIRFDGEGYPAAYANREPSVIPLVVAVADSFDAITSCRPYRGLVDMEKAIEIMQLEKGKQFHPGFAEAFFDLARAGALDHIIGHVSETGLVLECRDCGPILSAPHGAKDGEKIDCPSCRGEFVLHVSGGSFELEWSGVRKDAYLPKPDLPLVEQVVREAPKKIDIPTE